jgi:hypothetical protein
MQPRSGRRALGHVALVACLAVVVPAVAIAQGRAQPGPDGYKVATRLGTSGALYGPVPDMPTLRRMASTPRVQRLIRDGLTDVGLANKADEVLRILQSGEGVSEVRIEIGQTWDWMLYRRGNRAMACARSAGAAESRSARSSSSSTISTAPTPSWWPSHAAT